MAYASWSVVFGEQPSAAKWNILGSNDASFNDGTGIANMSMATTALSNPYKFSAYHNTTQSLTTGSKISFNTELYDTNSNFASSTYTAPVTGFYNIAASVYMQVTPIFVAPILRKNGADYLRGATGTSSGQDGSFTINPPLLSLTVGDTLEVYLTFAGGGSKTLYGEAPGQLYTYFGGYLVSRT